MRSVDLSVTAGAMSASAVTALVIVTILAWGAWGIFDKKALESGSPRDVFLILLLCELPQIPVAGAILYRLGLPWLPDWSLLLWPALSALTMTFSTLLYLMALKEAEASYVLGITASYPVLVQFMAVYIVGEPLNAAMLLGAILIAAGVFTVGFSDRRATDSGTTERRWFIVACALASTAAWGLYGLFDKKAVTVAEPWFVYFWQSVFNGLLILPIIALIRLSGHRPRLTSSNAWLYCGLSALSIAIGAIAYLYALTSASASYVITITGCYPLVMYALAVAILKERLNWVRVLGIALIVAGGVAVQIAHSL
jgi:drug/metabolite transporter (DMT)-like permease